MSGSLPSREMILDFLKSEEGRSSKRDIARAFNVRGADRIALKEIIRELKEEGLLKGGRGKLSEKGRIPPLGTLDIIDQDQDGELIGRLAQWDGDGEAPRMRLAPAGAVTFRPALGIGERVIARIERGEGGELIGVVEKRVGASAHRVLGVLRLGKGAPRVHPVDRRARGDLEIAPSHVGAAKDGDLVLCEPVLERGAVTRRARIVERIGAFSEPHAVSLIAIHAHRLRTVFPEGAVKEALAARPVSLQGREDLRGIPLITIDPDDARDHDDAVFAQADPSPANKGGFIIWVAIADVAHYVRPGSALDREASLRGNSTYFPDRVVPMLPEELSADLCSLKEGKERATLALRMIFGADGEKLSHKFIRGVMKSAARLTYSEVQRAFDGAPDGRTAPLLVDVLNPLFKAYGALKKARLARSPLELNLPEHRIRFGPGGMIAEITLRETLESMKLIEEFMVLANVAAAETLEAKRRPLLYRVHAPPDPEKLQAFREFSGSLDLKFPKAGTVRALSFNQLLHAAEGTDYEPMLHEVILRTQSQAQYAAENLGHFGLNLARYAHFTSPIRRYADLIVHRALIAGLALGADGQTKEEAEALALIGERISDAERRSMAAERDAKDRYLAAYLQDRIGAVFPGRISGVTRFGLFVRLTETGADGIIPIRSIGNDFFIHDERRHALVGRVSGAVYRLGEAVSVRLVEAAPVTGGLVFELESEPKSYEKPSKGTRGQVRAKGKAARKKRRP